MRILESRGLRVGIAQHTEVRRNPHFRPGGPEGSKSLEENCHGFVAPALQKHPRPLVERAERMPELKPLFAPNRNLFLGRRLATSAPSRQ